MNIHIITSEDGDWVALYKDGKLVEQNHSLHEKDVLLALDIPFTTEEWGEAEFSEHGYQCPEELPS